MVFKYFFGGKNKIKKNTRNFYYDKRNLQGIYNGKAQKQSALRRSDIRFKAEQQRKKQAKKQGSRFRSKPNFMRKRSKASKKKNENRQKNYFFSAFSAFRSYYRLYFRLFNN